MEKFDIEAFMNKLDEVGFNTLVMVNLPGLEIEKADLDLMVDQASEIYQCEHPGEDIRVIAHALDEQTYFVAVAYDNEMEIAP